MKIVTLCMTTILAGGLLTAYPLMAAPDASGKMMTSASAESGQSVRQLQTTASVILGNINIASIALVYGMNDDALSHINAARKSISDFDRQVSTYNYGMTPYSSTTPMTAGRLGFKTAQGESDYWIPVVNDRFSVRTINGERLTSRSPDVDFTDAQIVHFKMVLDTRTVDEQLAKAQNAINQKQYDVAMTALQNVSKGAITETVAEDRPLETTRDNLILSRELLQDKDYRGASFALQHANTELARYEKANPDSADTAQIKDMQSKIYALQTSIDKNEPSALKTAEAKIDGWIKDIKAKL